LAYYFFHLHILVLISACSLNFQAHLNDRRADNHILYKRFDEAVTCHKNAADLLLQAMQLTSVTQSLEALQLQYDYHKKQEDIIQ
jgi:hypothetical protein